MTDKNVNIKRVESILKEIVPEALSGLNDDRISGITVTNVKCSRGKYDAKVYFDGSSYSKGEQEQLSQLLNKANGHIKSYCLGATSWYKAPNFKFFADSSLENSLKIEQLFSQIKQSNQNG